MATWGYPGLLLLTTWTMLWQEIKTNLQILSLRYPNEMFTSFYLFLVFRVKLSQSNLNLVSTSSMVALTWKQFFVTLFALTLFSPTRTGLTALSILRLYTKASCWDCDDFYIHVGKTKRRLHDRETEHFKDLDNILICNESENVWTMNPNSFDSDYVAIAKSYPVSYSEK